MKYGVNTFIWTANFTRENLPLLPEIKRHGFDGVEVPLFRPADFALADIRKGLEQNGLECTICSVIPGGLSIISDDAAVRQKARTHMEDCIKTAAEVGAKIMAGPLYSPVGYLPGRRRTTDEWKWAVECYQSLGPVLDRHHVTIAIEPLNRFETYFLNTAADAVALCDQINHPNVGILFDTFHANIEEKSIAAGYRAVARHLLDAGAIGVMTTHDLSLAGEEPLKSSAKLVHFTETVDDRGAMRFDYCLREGLATSRNALRLMQIIGIDLKEGEGPLGSAVFHDSLPDTTAATAGSDTTAGHDSVSDTEPDIETE